MLNPVRLVAIGSDPEVFFVKDGTPHSVEGLVGGTKLRPKQMQGLPEGFFIQEDNVAAEYNIPPATDAITFADNIMLGLSYVRTQAQRHGMQVALAPCLDFPEEQLQTRHARRLGCDPDFNIWKLELNPTPKPPEKMRTAAGHVHISWTNPDSEQQQAIGKLCDLYLGVPSILVTKPNERRKLYGRAGAVRLKPYGIEYRTMDNFWLESRRWCEHVFTTITAMVDNLNREGSVLMDAVADFEEEIQGAINEHNPHLADVLCNRFDVPYFTQ